MFVLPGTHPQMNADESTGADDEKLQEKTENEIKPSSLWSKYFPDGYFSELKHVLKLAVPMVGNFKGVISSHFKSCNLFIGRIRYIQHMLQK